jgi:hypothetical protein
VTTKEAIAGPEVSRFVEWIHIETATGSRQGDDAPTILVLDDTTRRNKKETLYEN